MQVTDKELLEEIYRRIEEKESFIKDMEFVTNKLLTMNDMCKQTKESINKIFSFMRN